MSSSTTQLNSVTIQKIFSKTILLAKSFILANIIKWRKMVIQMLLREWIYLNLLKSPRIKSILASMKKNEIYSYMLKS